ncbi:MULTISPECIES: ABC transporter ATP-binding protein [Oceanotoga]|jgi:ABC-2 type transport system ATP-binding protein|uniref:ABC-2 type transport system ATP-binding protein n=1 Tax=Oceanotoga teriensis TaxID=515440 RepID=A0AA45C634_9BACT|nr:MULTISPECIES: ABC transporter ATP-binding protein [Oceanotoga]MDN5341765.1 type transport system ATP-binding protein [Oceanotoga sp.]MDO7975677.1 ABC transporter ATP-binding protein [Oceanotoga teriensis]PWJ90574.1 ABC-2 type transport system ATP-binding protein [Oceanotoga teriensis]
MEDILKIENFKKYYKDVKAVDGISLSIQKGKTTAILGPNGAGKTTTVETLEGLRKPTMGDIYYFGEKVFEIDRKIKERIGVQLQSTTFFDNLTVEEIIRAFGGLYKKSIETNILLKDLNLEEKRKARMKNLSGGQKQRVALACAIVNDPDIIFLDEPTTGLDPQARRNLWEQIDDFKKRGKTVVLTTHYMEEAEFLADYIYVIDHGKIIAEGTVDKLIKSLNMNSLITFETLDFDSNIDLFNGDLKKVDDVYQYETDDVEKSLIKIFEYSKEKNFKIDNLKVRKPNLEDVFLTLTGRSLRD